MINGKAKGNEFERKVAKLLSEWSGKEFNRTPGSGSIHWADNNSVTGDIVAPPELNFPVSVECKKHEIDYDIMKIISSTNHEIWKFWEQACTDANRATKKIPWLIFSKNRCKVYVMMEYKYYFRLSDGNLSRVQNNVTVRHTDKDGNEIVTVIMELEQLLSKVTVYEVCNLSV